LKNGVNGLMKLLLIKPKKEGLGIIGFIDATGMGE
jgi:hypothetical protein